MEKKTDYMILQELTKNEKSYLNMMDFALGKIDYEEFMKRFSM